MFVITFHISFVRLLYPFTCPNNGIRNDSCQCTDDGTTNAGRTRYSKLRIDLHNMKINGMMIVHTHIHTHYVTAQDMTFARTEYGVDVALGVAGDCYSAVDCPQGVFSIDLRRSGLRLADHVRWIDHGHRTSSRIERTHVSFPVYV